MVTSVKLQPPFEYSWWTILIAVVLMLAVLAMLSYCLIKLLLLRDKKKAAQPAARKLLLTPDVLLRIKNTYTKRVQQILADYKAGKVSKREGYQQLSLVIRGFVHEVTGINVETFTVKEVKQMGIRKLDVLMEEYYVPEFGEDERARDKDLEQSLNVAMGVIKTWI